MAPPSGLILGIDPGLAATGYGVLGDRDEVLAFGSIKTVPGSAAPRLLEVVEQVERVLAQFRVTEAALEELFMGRNRTSAIAVAQARGAILAALQRAGVRAFEYKPSQIKALITGYGMADKAQMARMLCAQVRGAQPLKADSHAVDALAVAMCHSRTRRLMPAVTR